MVLHLSASDVVAASQATFDPKAAAVLLASVCRRLGHELVRPAIRPATTPTASAPFFPPEPAAPLAAVKQPPGFADEAQPFLLTPCSSAVDAAPPAAAGAEAWGRGVVLAPRGAAADVPAPQWRLPKPEMRAELKGQLTEARATCWKLEPNFAKPDGVHTRDKIVEWQLRDAQALLDESCRVFFACPEAGSDCGAAARDIVVGLLCRALRAASQMAIKARPHPGYSRPTDGELAAAKASVSASVAAAFAAAAANRTLPRPACETLLNLLNPRVANAIIGGLFGLLAEPSSLQLLQAVVGAEGLVESAPPTTQLYGVLHGVDLRVRSQPDAVLLLTEKPGAVGGTLRGQLLQTAGWRGVGNLRWQVEMKNRYGRRPPRRKDVVQACIYGHAAGAPAVLIHHAGGLSGRCSWQVEEMGNKKGGCHRDAALSGEACPNLQLFVLPQAYCARQMKVRGTL